MNLLKTFSEEEITRLCRKRSGEQKLGEAVSYCGERWEKQIAESKARYVVLGIPEDIGVRANYGRPGADSAFMPALTSFLNQQRNVFMDPSLVMIGGEVNLDDIRDRANQIDGRSKGAIAKLRDLVAEIDGRVSTLIEQLAHHNKIPLVIGGGHNNAYGNIAGVSRALSEKIGVLNCDPHADLREREGRHSGNGFTYAFTNGYLEKYAVLGLHEQYNNQHVMNEFRNNSANFHFESFEEIFVREALSYSEAIARCVGFVKCRYNGLELDLDAITNVPSSAKTSSGISALQARQFVHRAASMLDCRYFHIAEGAPVLSHIKTDNKTGKLIAYLLTDFIKATETLK